MGVGSHKVGKPPGQDQPGGSLRAPAQTAQDAALVQLDDIALFKPPGNDPRGLLHRLIALGMGHNRVDPLRRNGVQHGIHIIGLLVKEKFHQQIVGAGQSHQLLPAQQLHSVRHTHDLRTGLNLQGDARIPDLPHQLHKAQSQRRVPEILFLCPGQVAVGRGNDRGHAAVCRHAGHEQRGIHGIRSVVAVGQYVAVNIDHGNTY